MSVNFAGLVQPGLVDIIGISIGILVLIVILAEIVRWRRVVSPIIQGRSLGWARWVRILIQTIKNEAIIQQIDIGFDKRKWLSHSLVMWGFLLLGVSTTLNWIYDPSGYPLPIWHSVRIIGNTGGLFLIIGLTIIVLRYASDNVKRDCGSTSGYLFAFLLIMAGATGFASEFASEVNSVVVYQIYVIHLLSSAVLLVTAPLTKFVHAIGRPLLRLSENYAAALITQKSSEHLSMMKLEVKT